MGASSATYVQESPPESLPREGVMSNDMGAFAARLIAVASWRGLKLDILADIDGLPLWFLPGAPGSRRRLAAAGFHGDEHAGPWGLLRFLEDAPDDLLAGLAFLPIVNPTGFQASRRNNALGEPTNGGFCRGDLPENQDDAICREGRILLERLPPLAEIAARGFVSLHEDRKATGRYLYSFERAAAPGAFSRALLAAGAPFFPVESERISGDVGEMDGGVILNKFDGSFENLIHDVTGAPCAATETPACGVPPDPRIAANAAILAAFAAHCG